MRGVPDGIRRRPGPCGGRAVARAVAASVLSLGLLAVGGCGGEVRSRPSPIADWTAASVEVTLEVTSGRPGPRWVLRDPDVLEAMLELLRAGRAVAEPADAAGVLGYRGFLLAASPADPRFPGLIRVFGGHAEVLDERRPESSWLMVGPELEAMLLEQARDRGHGSLVGD